jgi:hypothetical protein
MLNYYDSKLILNSINILNIDLYVTKQVLDVNWSDFFIDILIDIWLSYTVECLRIIK